MLKYLFGYSPIDAPAWVYNSAIGTIGAAFYADTLAHFVGIVLILESVLVSVERCWPKSERPE